MDNCSRRKIRNDFEEAPLRENSGGVFAFEPMETALKEINGPKVKLTAVVDILPADLLTPLAVFLALSRNSKNCFLLESVEGGESLARYSFIATDPDAIVRSVGSSVELRNFNEVHDSRFDCSMVEFLRRYFETFTVETNGNFPAFVGGAIGYLGFDCVDWFEPSLAGKSSTGPSSEFMICKSVVAFDHAKQVVNIVSLADVESADAVGSAQKRNELIRKRLENLRLERPERSTDVSPSPAVSNFVKTDFLRAVERAKEHIFAGDCYQVVLSQRFSKPTSASDISIYRALRSTNPSPYMFLLRFPDRSLIGSSPEMLVRCMGRRLEYRPIAGTRARGTTVEEDASLAEEMRGDKKEVAEHLMLVDLGRNDLGRVAEYGSVKVDELMKVEKYSHVQHLVSSLSAVLRTDRDRFDALASCFPAGTVSGAPKVRAIEIIRELEPDHRGIYAGAVGYLDHSGNMDTCIAIRTLVLENGVAHVQAGAGIVADSDPEREYEETVNKARALLRAVAIAESGEL